MVPWHRGCTHNLPGQLHGYILHWNKAGILVLDLPAAPGLVWHTPCVWQEELVPVSVSAHPTLLLQQHCWPQTNGADIKRVSHHPSTALILSTPRKMPRCQKVGMQLEWRFAIKQDCSLGTFSSEVGDLSWSSLVW